MFWVIIGIAILLCVLLCVVVLLQNPKGGLASGVASSQLMGVKRTTDLLERLTWGFMIAVIVLVVSSSFVIPNASDEGSTPTIKRNRQGAAPAIQQPAPSATPATPQDTN
jgi:preprotein translocase subunit SecG